MERSKNFRKLLCSIIAPTVFVTSLFLTHAALATGSAELPTSPEELEKLQLIEYEGETYNRLHDEALRTVFEDTAAGYEDDSIADNFLKDGTCSRVGGVVVIHGEYWIADSKLCCKVRHVDEANCRMAFVNDKQKYLWLGLNPSFSTMKPYPIIIRKLPK